MSFTRRTKIALRGGGGWHGDPFAQTPPPPPWSPCREGGFGLGLPYLPCRGGGVQPQHTCLKMIPTSRGSFSLPTCGGNFFREKNFSRPKFVFRRLWWQHPSLHKTKGPARKPISGTPPPSFAGRPCHPPPPLCKAVFGPPKGGTFFFGGTPGGGGVRPPPPPPWAYTVQSRPLQGSMAPKADTHWNGGP